MHEPVSSNLSNTHIYNTSPTSPPTFVTLPYVSSVSSTGCTLHLVRHGQYLVTAIVITVQLMVPIVIFMAHNRSPARRPAHLPRVFNAVVVLPLVFFALPSIEFRIVDFHLLLFPDRMVVQGNFIMLVNQYAKPDPGGAPAPYMPILAGRCTSDRNLQNLHCQS